jgi:hypothetical protein
MGVVVPGEGILKPPAQRRLEPLPGETGRDVFSLAAPSGDDARRQHRGQGGHGLERAVGMPELVRFIAQSKASVGRYANGQSACIAKRWVRCSCHGLLHRLRQRFQTRFWRTFSETSPHLSICLQAEPPIRERKNKVDPFGNECRPGAATCGLFHFDDSIQLVSGQNHRG